MPPVFRPDPQLPDVIRVTPELHADGRGWFRETYNRDDFRRGGIDCEFMQDNHSLSEATGTIRGLHFQTAPFEQTKLVRCLRGRVLDVVVDIRRGSRTFGKHTAIELSAENADLIFIPKGFAHGFCTLEENCEIAYKVDAPYSAAHATGIAFDDPDLAIAWPRTSASFTLSDQDRALQSFSEYSSSLELPVEGAAG